MRTDSATWELCTPESKDKDLLRGLLEVVSEATLRITAGSSCEACGTSSSCFSLSSPDITHLIQTSAYFQEEKQKQTAFCSAISDATIPHSHRQPKRDLLATQGFWGGGFEYVRPFLRSFTETIPRSSSDENSSSSESSEKVPDIDKLIVISLADSSRRKQWANLCDNFTKAKEGRYWTLPPVLPPSSINPCCFHNSLTK